MREAYYVFSFEARMWSWKTFFDPRFMDLHFERGVSRLLHAEYRAPVSVLRLSRHDTRLCRDDKAMLDEHTTSIP